MEKIGVRQVEQPGGIIRHHIGRARYVVVKVDVSMEALVKGLKAEEVGGRACRSGRATALKLTLQQERRPARGRSIGHGMAKRRQLLQRGLLRCQFRDWLPGPSGQ